MRCIHAMPLLSLLILGCPGGTEPEDESGAIYWASTLNGQTLNRSDTSNVVRIDAVDTNGDAQTAHFRRIGIEMLPSGRYRFYETFNSSTGTMKTAHGMSEFGTYTRSGETVTFSADFDEGFQATGTHKGSLMELTGTRIMHLYTFNDNGVKVKVSFPMALKLSP